MARGREIGRIAALGSIVLMGLAGAAPATGARQGATSVPVQTITVAPSPAASAVDDATGRLFVTHPWPASGPGHVSVLDAARGVLLRTVTVLDAARGVLLRTVTVGYVPLAVAVDQRTGRIFVLNNGDSTRGGRAFFNDKLLTTAPGNVSVLDAASGTVLRTVAVGRSPNALTVDQAAGHVFITAVSNTHEAVVSVLAAADGRLLHTQTLGTTAGPVAVAAGGGRAVALTNDDRAYLLDGAGRVLHTARVGVGAAAVAVDAATGRAFVANQLDNTVSVIDTADGVVRATVAVGVLPGAVAVDATDGRVFVANTGDDTVSVLDARRGAVLRTVAAGQAPWALTASNDGRAGHATAVVVATTDGANVLDGASGAPRATLPVSVGVAGMALDAALGRAFLVEDFDHTVRVFDLPGVARPAAPAALARTVERTRALAQAFVDAYNRHDVAAVLALLAPRFQYSDCDEAHHSFRAVYAFYVPNPAAARHQVAAWLRADFAARDYFVATRIVVSASDPRTAGVSGLRVNDALRAQGRVAYLGIKIIIAPDGAYIDTAVNSSQQACTPAG